MASLFHVEDGEDVIWMMDDKVDVVLNSRWRQHRRREKKRWVVVMVKEEWWWRKFRIREKRTFHHLFFVELTTESTLQTPQITLDTHYQTPPPHKTRTTLIPSTNFIGTLGKLDIKLPRPLQKRSICFYHIVDRQTTLIPAIINLNLEAPLI